MSRVHGESPYWIGIDIGGANIKIATSADPAPPPVHSQTKQAISIPFPLWKTPEKLTDVLIEALTEIASKSDRPGGLAVTMTGELVDGYLNRCVGVAAIVDAVMSAVQHLESAAVISASSGESGKEFPILFYQLASNQAGYCWADAAEAKREWLSTAAANWHAIGSFLGQVVPQTISINPFHGNGFLIDLGSTTTDIIPLRNGLVAALGTTDLSRLQARELVYAGAQRTSVTNLVSSVELDGCQTAIARESFATIEDCFLVTGELAGENERVDTADGRPAIAKFAFQRLAKLVCADAQIAMQEAPRLGDARSREILSEQQIILIAEQIIQRWEQVIASALIDVVQRNADLPLTFLLTGQGDWLAEPMVTKHFPGNSHVIRLGRLIGQSNSRAMGAYAVANLAHVDFSPRIASRPVAQREHHSIANSKGAIDTPAAAILPNRRYGAGSISLGSGDHQECPRGGWFEPDSSLGFPLRVIKIGGSLLSKQGSPERIRDWLAQQPDRNNVWLVGGGEIVDAIQAFERRFKLAESTAHYLCLAGMSLNLRLVQTWFPEWALIGNWDDGAQFFREAAAKAGGGTNVLIDFSTALKPLAGMPLPESQSISSDSCAAYLARAIKAIELVLLKSCPINPADGLNHWLEKGIVDREFPQFAQQLDSVRLVGMGDDCRNVLDDESVEP